MVMLDGLLVRIENEVRCEMMNKNVKILSTWKSTLVCRGHLRDAVVPSSACREKSWRELAMVARGSLRVTLYWESRGGEVKAITMEICLQKIVIFLSVYISFYLAILQYCLSVRCDRTALALLPLTEGIVIVRGEDPHLSASQPSQSSQPPPELQAHRSAKYFILTRSPCCPSTQHSHHQGSQFIKSCQTGKLLLLPFRPFEGFAFDTS